MIELLATALSGYLLGGLANQLATDLLARRPLRRPHCPYCDTPRPHSQWLALPAFLLGQARCPSCSRPIRTRNLVVEVGSPLIYVVLWLRFGLSPQLLFSSVYFFVLIMVLITDIERRLILTRVMAPAIVFALLASFVTPNQVWWSGITGGAIGFTFFLIAWWVGQLLFGPGALGQGDITLALFVGLITGFPLVIEALLITLVSGAVVSLALLALRLRSLRDPIPYGPFLVLGAAVTLLWGYQLAEWYLRR